MKNNYLTFISSSVLALGTALAFTPSASAFTFNNDGSITFDNTMIGESFTVDFLGNSNTQNITNMTSEAVFTYQGLNSGLNSDNDPSTFASFDVVLENTSTNGLTSRTSALGFDVNPNIVGATVNGDFENAILGSRFPNQFGSIEVCFIDNRNNCNGGQSGGTTTNDTEPFEFDLTLEFNTNDFPVTEFTLSNFGVRYQSINGTGILDDGSTVNFNGGSGTGMGTPRDPNTPPPEPQDPVDVPEPATLLGLGLFTLTAAKFTRKKK